MAKVQSAEELRVFRETWPCWSSIAKGGKMCSSALLLTAWPLHASLIFINCISVTCKITAATRCETHNSLLKLLRWVPTSWECQACSLESLGDRDPRDWNRDWNTWDSHGRVNLGVESRDVKTWCLVIFFSDFWCDLCVCFFFRWATPTLVANFWPVWPWPRLLKMSGPIFCSSEHALKIDIILISFWCHFDIIIYI